MPPTETQRAHCPACRAQRAVRVVGKATIARQPVKLTQCKARDCGLIWAVRAATLTGGLA